MDHLDILIDLRLLRSVIAGASNRTGAWKRRLWLGRLTQLVHNICSENQESFLNSLPGNANFLRLLRTGYFEVYDVFVVPELHLDSPGRVVAALALLVFILNDLDAHSAASGFDSGFLIDRLCVPLWLKARAYKITQSSRTNLQPSSSPDKTTPTSSQ
ncbi:E1B-19k [Deer mastadenovirus B]|uniref:E1B protein, small T-antigen n=1 Tax=Deer mastadenovirus B TaxID=2170000 RepID=A0A1Y0B6F3_9ADEN|nr:E1B-19k [Deer mastadenovirus B]ART33359.1 E1B-19k [Deer mastadenovirus B]